MGKMMMVRTETIQIVVEGDPEVAARAAELAARYLHPAACDRLHRRLTRQVFVVKREREVLEGGADMEGLERDLDRLGPRAVKR